MDPIAAGCPQLIDLGVVDLIVRRHPGVAYQPLGRLMGVNGLPLCHGAFKSLVWR